MQLLTYLIVATLGIITLLHVIWGAGVKWPLKDEKSLVQAIAGFKDMHRMPPAVASYFVAFLVLVAAGLALDLGHITNLFPRVIALTGGLIVASVFWGRGVLGYTQLWANITPEQPFRRLDGRVYSPLCLGLGSGFSILVWNYLQVV